MSLSIVVKIGAALGVGGLVYWGLAAWAKPAGAASMQFDATKPAAKPAAKPATTKPASKPAASPTGEISGTVNAADAVASTDVDGNCYNKRGMRIPCGLAWEFK